MTVATADRDRLVINHLALVRKVAVGLVRRLPAQVELNELIGEGVVGLLSAAERYRPASGVPFEAFAARRVRGSMLDALRALDVASRRTRRLERGIKTTTAELRQTLGRDPVDAEIAGVLGLSAEAFARARQQTDRAQTCGFVTFEDAFGDDHRALTRALGAAEDDPESTLQRVQLHTRLRMAIGELPERERQILTLYYDEELTMAQIAQLLGLSESRISQLRTLALSKLRRHLALAPGFPTDGTARQPARAA